MEKLVAWALTTLVSAFIGSYLGAYLKKKGENLATHEDIDKLLDQVRAVTTTTKEIEAKISGDVWDQQKRWELRRDAVFDALKNMGHVEDALSALYAVYRTDQESTEGSSERLEEKLKAYRTFNNAANDLDHASLLVGLVCGDQLRVDLLEFGVLARDIVKRVHEGEPAAFIAWGTEFVNKSKAITQAMRLAIQIRT